MNECKNERASSRSGRGVRRRTQPEEQLHPVPGAQAADSPPPASRLEGSPLPLLPIVRSAQNLPRAGSPGRQGDIKKRGGEEGEGAELKESAPSTSQSPPPDGILEAAGDPPPGSSTTSRHPGASPRRRSPTAGPRRAGTRGSGGPSRIPEPGSRTTLPRLKCQGDKPAPPPPRTGISQRHQRGQPTPRTAAGRRRPRHRARDPSPSGPAALSGAPANLSAPLPPLRRGQRRERRRVDSQADDRDSPGGSLGWNPRSPSTRPARVPPQPTSGTQRSR